MRTSQRYQSSIVSSSSSAFEGGILVARPEGPRKETRSCHSYEVSVMILLVYSKVSDASTTSRVHIIMAPSENIGLGTTSQSDDISTERAANKPLTRTVNPRATGRVSGPRSAGLQTVERAGIPSNKEVRIG